MSTDTYAADDVDADTGPTPPLPDEQGRHRLREDAGDPGHTTVEDVVVEKIAARAAGEVDQVGGAANRVLGVTIGADGADRSPKVTARVDGSLVTLDVRLSVTYPAPVGKVTREVREHVIERLATLTGLTARQVDITVAALHAPTAPQRRLA
jgi:uncharacterized alkaline shock family protein YloU